jgi:hypothetical protein
MRDITEDALGLDDIPRLVPAQQSINLGISPSPLSSSVDRSGSAAFSARLAMSRNSMPQTFVDALTYRSYRDTESGTRLARRQRTERRLVG